MRFKDKLYNCINTYVVEKQNVITLPDFNFLLSLISEARKEKIRRLIFDKDKSTSLLSELLIRYLIINELKCQNKQISFKYNKYGKPALINNTDFYFNISHSGKYIVCSISKSEVGVDIEKIERIDYLSIAKRFFYEDELLTLLHKTYKQEQLSYFYKLLTCKAI